MRATKKTVIALIAVGTLTVGAAIAIDKRPDSPGPGASSDELVAAARRTYEECKERMPIDPDRYGPEDLYIWSKRWMTARPTSSTEHAQIESWAQLRITSSHAASRKRAGQRSAGRYSAHSGSAICSSARVVRISA